ncbi:hypothetical protein N7481_002000 [Penicillium waksmanii]|uniref:uncharacterized protein n=1 Tax=Penicillium waksmanii TaxID=69791 RepID=UPI002549A451|nr:uncharacterized protein N7481_002000 [Penicillium waksmanii]KAJ5995023.1 hypothetical protein N7481_002000 [Penicillium waksmanii]
MHFKVIPALLMLAPAVLANPVATDAADLSASDTDELNDALANIPSSILTVLATAIPQSWYMELLDPASQSAFLSEASAGIYPDWYSALPSSVIAWASSAAENGDDFLFGSATATDESASGSTATGSRSSARTASASATATATATATQTETDSESSTESSTATNSNTDSTTATSDAKSSETASNTASSAASSTPASETSTGGAPLATGSVAMGLAGAAGLLGLIAVL